MGIVKRHMTKEHKEKIRQALLGRKRPKEVIEKMSLANKGQTAWNKGLKMSKEFSIAMSIANKNRNAKPPLRKGIRLTEEQRQKMKGRRPWNYKEDRRMISGGLFRKDSKEYKRWAKDVKHRDGYSCALSSNECKGRLESHHILNWIDFPEERFNINNGITLCQFHHPYTRKEEEAMEPLFNSILSITWQAAW